MNYIPESVYKGKWNKCCMKNGRLKKERWEIISFKEPGIIYSLWSHRHVIVFWTYFFVIFATLFPASLAQFPNEFVSSREPVTNFAQLIRVLTRRNDNPAAERTTVSFVFLTE